MALVDRKSSVQIRHTNKEPEWSSLCNNVFDQYLDDDDLFGVKRERSSSGDSGNLFDFSGSSEQSHRTDATSPIPSWTANDKPIAEAKQPKAKAPVDFWHKKLRALEQNAADCERRQQKLRTAKSHPDFLSLGGFPSPPAIPVSPTGQSLSVQRQRSRQLGPAANGKKVSTQRSVTNLRAVSRGRPVGVTKPPASAAINPNATIRKHSASPSKMMTPSRYRAGFKDVWAERIQNSPKKFELRLPSNTTTFPDSPPPSARSTQDTFAAFGSPTYPPVPRCDDQISPLASTFQQAARIHTPIASPLLSPGSHATSYFEHPPPLPTNPYATVPLNDVAPLYPERGSSLAANKIQEFDFGFSSSPDLNETWPAAPFAEPPSTSYSSTDPFTNTDPFGNFNNSLLINQQSQNHNLGLGISCNPSVISGNFTPSGTVQDISHLVSVPTFQTPLANSPFYVPSLPNGLPNTPRRQRDSPARSPSPPATESRSRRASGSRRNSRHRRTKSATTTPRHHQGADKGGFVNFTPQDHGKILNGVAPSGSSKTKARREKEAAEKRRRLSEAAMKAVIDAGGDVETLQKAGLIV